MTDSYLRSLGFADTDDSRSAVRPAFGQAWRYLHEAPAQDGASLFIEHPLGIAGCRLSTLPAPLAAQQVAATVGLHDRRGLEAAIAAFYAAHGGQAAVPAAAVPHTFLPYRQQR